MVEFCVLVQYITINVTPTGTRHMTSKPSIDEYQGSCRCHLLHPHFHDCLRITVELSDLGYSAARRFDGS